MKDNKFIAVNILPPRDNEDFAQALARFKRQLEKAYDWGYTHVWLNPICQLDDQEPIRRRDLDTGVPAVLYQSLYAFPEPTKIRAFFSNVQVINIIKEFKEREKNPCPLFSQYPEYQPLSESSSPEFLTYVTLLVSNGLFNLLVNGFLRALAASSMEKSLV